MLTKEKLEYHISHLQEQHRNLDKVINAMYRLNENDLQLDILKKKKLAIKDEIVRLANQLRQLENEV